MRRKGDARIMSAHDARKFVMAGLDPAISYRRVRYP